MDIYSVKNNNLLKKDNIWLDKYKLINIIYNIINHLLKIKDVKREYLLHLDDGRIINSKEWSGWEWTHGVALYAIYKFYKFTNNNNLLKIINDWFNFHFLKDMPHKNINTICPFLTLAYLYEDNKNYAFKSLLENWSNWLMYDLPRTKNKGFQHIVYHKDNNEEIWDDTLMMSILPLLKIGLILNKPSFINEAIYQILIHSKYLINIKTGLWFHGWSFSNLNNFANVEWGRGNSWITIAIPEIIELIKWPIDNPIRKYLIELLKIQIDSLVQYQDKTGLWHTILNDKKSYLEISCSAGFAYGILKSINNRYINNDYLNVAVKAIKGIIKYITKDGIVKQVSAGTGMGWDKNYYMNIPLTTMPYGQAMAILALTEYIKTYL